MNKRIYWVFLAGLGFVHLQFLLTDFFAWRISIFLALFLAALPVYFLSRKTVFSVQVAGKRYEYLLMALQIPTLALQFGNPPVWVSTVAILMFIGIETARIFINQKVAMLEKDLTEFAEQREHFNETFRIVRSERHDFLKHVSSIQFMLENEQYDEARTYLNQLVGTYEQTNLSIKGEHGVVAGVLHQMYRRAKNAGIEIVYDTDLPISSMPLNDKKIVDLVGNLLSNSIDACEEWQEQHQRPAQLTLQFYKRSGLFLLICKNNSLPLPSHIVDQLFHSYGRTTKSGHHEGLGTKVIKDIVEEHMGFLDFIHKDEEFTLKIKIPAIR
ncbi:GHKL domain-containing protein [Mesobacillus maritimus]|uniref:sensor histidine kinase n=1 Tax=Mesobacillus maritimus TaxID=1643336 RepID=UPI00203CB415|nr:GHKL domain-containing protein [Mesobacillus maritimus]MCM3585467.1 GHKL domain-containing protein [Mesobacillus maritimus]MCM3669726.1 GHKL domain-containing protein [Mesobacillus maritimus]